MGGNLFKLGRISKARYGEIHQKIKPFLDAKFGNQYRIPRYYRDKADFGDMDIIISSAAVKGDWQKLKAEIKEDLKITHSKTVGNVFSTVFENFQVDFFWVNEREFLSTYNFLSFNDIGNLIGKICRRFNLKYGEKGLCYVYRRADGHYAVDIALSKDFRRIYDFLKLDYGKWKNGFDSREDMFEWVIASPYFSTRPYEKLSRSTEKRLRERATIQHFLLFLEKKQIVKHYEYLENKAEYLPLINSFFSEAGLLDTIAEEQQREDFLKTIKEKYNGRIIMDLFPLLKGKKLGSFIHAFQDQFLDYERVLFDATPENIKEMLLDFYKKYTTG